MFMGIHTLELEGFLNFIHPRLSFGNTEIFNPGSLNEKKFGFLKIKASEQGNWYLESSENVSFK
jgi:hypothetical protein